MFRRYSPSKALKAVGRELARFAEIHLTGKCGCLKGDFSHEAHAAISAELVACTLGQRKRPELEVTDCP